VTEDPPNLVLLDLNLPFIDGLEVCRLLRGRAASAAIPIIMVTARTSETDRVSGLELGADDYVTKPFSLRELVARVRAVLRRVESAKQADHPPVYNKGGLKIDFTTYEVFARGRSVKLTLKEFELLRFLVQNPNRVLSRDQLLDRVWGGETFVTPRTVDVHIRRLRKAIEKDDSKPQWILTLRGVGYKFDEKALEQ
jgi:DNA-binding response OmpR family regulator